MSYSVNIVCDHCNHNVYESNYTYNVSPMLHDVGLKFLELIDITAKDLIPTLELAICKLEDNPEKYKAMNPENGWGNYDTMLEGWLKPLLEACKSNTNMRIYIG